MYVLPLLASQLAVAVTDGQYEVRISMMWQGSSFDFSVGGVPRPVGGEAGSSNIHLLSSFGWLVQYCSSSSVRVGGASLFGEDEALDIMLLVGLHQHGACCHGLRFGPSSFAY